MAELAVHERLQPSLLDRLVDNLAGIERELERAKPRLLTLLDDAERETFTRLMDPERRMAEPLRPADLEAFSRLDADGWALLERVVALEERRVWETRQHHVISMDRLRDCVRRDLEHLFNADHFEASQPLDGFPHVRRSVVNYGIPALAGAVLRSVDIERLEGLVRDAVREFEPRIRRDSLRVVARLDDRETSRNALVFEIEGELWGDPMPMRVFLRTIIDLDDGSARITEGGA